MRYADRIDGCTAKEKTIRMDGLLCLVDDIGLDLHFYPMG